MGSYVPSTQAQREQMLRAVGLENIMDLYRDVPEPVSYTHLDVYKRQVSSPDVSVYI